MSFKRVEVQMYFRSLAISVFCDLDELLKFEIVHLVKFSLNLVLL